MSKKHSEIVKKTIESIDKKFQPDELAYLALTSKIENPIRDKVAFELEQKLRNSHIICREWTNNKQTKAKADLAILDKKGKPECIIEFKAHSAVAGLGQWARDMVLDVKKNQDLNGNVEIIFVLFANYLTELPKNAAMNHSVKYYDDLVKAINRGFSVDDQNAAWKKAVGKKVNTSELTFYSLKGGKFHGVDVTVNAFIHENIVLLD